MTRKGFKMFLYPGMAEEYERRHNELWPEMKEMIRRHGGKNYSIFLDRETNVLYGYLEVEDEALWAGSADTPINRNGGITWLILWKPTGITARYAWISNQCSIWIKDTGLPHLNKIPSMRGARTTPWKVFY